MASPPLRVLVLGRGRLGGALARALRASGCRVRLAPGRSASSGRGADLVLLCVHDRAVAEVAARLAGSLAAGPTVAHCSGALDLSALEPLRRRGVPVGALHPLQAVPSPATRLACHAALEASTPAAARLLARAARGAGLVPFPLAGANRALYHAAASLASNGLLALAARAAALLEGCGLPRARARRALLPLLRSALEGLEARGLPGALTGPVARGDAAVVEAHLAALARAAPDDLALYRALGAVLVGLARELGQAQPEQLEAVAQALTRRGRAPSRGRRRAPRAAPAPRRPRRGRAARAPRSS